MTKAFVSYHHANDQHYRDHLAYLANYHHAFEDGSVVIGDIEESLTSEAIRRVIRDGYLRDTQVTILLCGTETRFRKHIDWELKSSMIDGLLNKRSGILVVELPSTNSNHWVAALPGEKDAIYPDYTSGWTAIETKAEQRERHPHLPERIIANLIKPGVAMSVVPWHRIENQPENLKFLVDATAKVGRTNEYDLSLPMRRKNYNTTLA
ncbi:TIR domain-containing protein [Rhodobacter sp. NTK016B]|uniref:TIR domain-containing protein n=1 Tax=Rhodobacter sp. NTK016B TaxID=2759676 RepID=UPI001A90C5B1|nr:TIR domain-containing protein [Rhodobacter sp. NTK016B]MBN8291426.1 TIR domain-containing protein [Rhodobacter sp. NTK016B]